MISSETQRYGLENNTTHAMVTSDNSMQVMCFYSFCLVYNYEEYVILIVIRLISFFLYLGYYINK